MSNAEIKEAISMFREMTWETQKKLYPVFLQTLEESPLPVWREINVDMYVHLGTDNLRFFKVVPFLEKVITLTKWEISLSNKVSTFVEIIRTEYAVTTSHENWEVFIKSLDLKK